MNKVKKKSIYLIGAGGHARSCIDVIECNNEYIIKGLLGYDSEVGKKVLNYEVVDVVDNYLKYNKNNIYFLLTIGLINNSQKRKNLFNKLSSTINFATIISPKSYVSSYSKINKGTIVMHDVLINANVKIGKNCIINSKSLIEHDTIIDNHTHISTYSVINGSVKIGENSFIGSKSVLENNLTLPQNSFIPMGRKITRNTKFITNYEK